MEAFMMSVPKRELLISIMSNRAGIYFSVNLVMKP